MPLFDKVRLRLPVMAPKKVVFEPAWFTVNVRVFAASLLVMTPFAKPPSVSEPTV